MIPTPSISTHVLDAALGRPAADVTVTLEAKVDGGWTMIARSATNTDGRVPAADWAADAALPGSAPSQPDRTGSDQPGDFRLIFDTATYFARTGQLGFYPEISICFTVADVTSHHHVPVLLSPFAFSTYRGS